MLAFAFGTLLIVRNTLVYGAAAAAHDHAAGTPPSGNAPIQTKMSESTFNRLQRVAKVTQPQSDETKFCFRPDFAVGDDNFLENALGAWAAVIKHQIMWEETATFIAQKDIVDSRREILGLLGRVIVWKNDDVVSRTGNVHHLIIRQVDSDTCEWIEVYQMEGEIDSELEFPVELRPIDSTTLGFQVPPGEVHEQWGWSGEKRLSEICRPSAEQQMHKWQCSLDEIIQQIQEDPTKLNLDLLRIHKERLYSLFEELQVARKRERDRHLREETESNGLARELMRQELIVGELEEQQARSENIREQMEEQIRNLIAQRTQMTDSVKGMFQWESAVAAENESLKRQMAKQQQTLGQERVRNEYLVQDLERQQVRNEVIMKELKASGMREQKLSYEKQQAEEQSRETEKELSEVVDQLEACQIQAENQESQRAEAQHQLEECQREAADSEQEFDRKEKETNRWIMMAALIGGSAMLLLIGIFIFVLCRKAGKEIIETSEEMKRKLGAQRERQRGHPLPNGQPGSIAIDIAEMDPQFRCSRDPQIAAFRHSILADENGQFGINQIEEETDVTEQEGIDISAVTRQSTIGNGEGGAFVIQAIKEGVKGAVERKQRKQMHVEPLKAIVENAVVVQDEVMNEIVEDMETDKAPEPQVIVDE